jgi:hypothetical protein
MKELEGRKFTALTVAPGAQVYCQRSLEALLGPEPASAAVTLTFMDLKTGPRLSQEALFLRSQVMATVRHTGLRVKAVLQTGGKVQRAGGAILGLPVPPRERVLARQGPLRGRSGTCF